MAVTFQDYYTTLGVARDASSDEIKKAFRKLARIYHPDVAKDGAGAEAKFKEINEANEVLGDPEKRRKYDLLGAGGADNNGGFPSPRYQGGGGPDQEFHFGGTGFSDFFEQYFSGATRYGFPHGEGDGFDPAPPHHSAPRARRGSDIEGDLLVTLSEAMLGTTRPITMQIVNRRTGQIETREFQVRIPPGATDGRRMRVPAQGESGQGGAPAGDLFLRVRHAMHPEFSSREADIFHELDIAPWEAVLGAELVVPTLDGFIKLRIPPHAENGQKLRVRSRGLPINKTGERGDFYVLLKMQLPTELSSEDRVHWEQLRDTATFNPRKAPL